MIPTSIIVNLISLIYPVVSAIREKHYVKRNSAVFNGLLLIGTGIGILIETSSLRLFDLPLFIFPILIGIAGIALTSSKEKLGTTICSGLVTSIILFIILVIQIKELGFSTI